MNTTSKLWESKVLIRFSDCDPFNHLNNARYIDYFINAQPSPSLQSELTISQIQYLPIGFTHLILFAVLYKNVWALQQNSKAALENKCKSGLYKS